MKIQDVMSLDLHMLCKDSTIVDASKMMSKYDIGSVLVGDDLDLEGILTDRDIVIAIAKGKELCCKIGDIMSTNVITLKPNDEIGVAISEMRENQIRRLPVINDEGRVCGIVSLGDLAVEEMSDQRAGVALSDISMDKIAKHIDSNNTRVDDYRL